MTLQSFLSSQEVSENIFYGIYKKQNDNFGHISEIISAAEGKFLIHPDKGWRMQVGVPTNLMQLEDGAFYQFSLMLAPDRIRTEKEDNYYLFLNTRSRVEKLSFNPYAKIIEQRFDRLDNPDANLIIASLLREVGKGLYSSKKRMFFELLQNADDVPTPSGNVRFYLETKGDYLILMHDGLPFDKDDVESITSAAESTKQKRQDKTGYKGIGFKSVFTDSEEVIIKSGGFSFKFDRHNPRYQNFDKFYFERQRYIEYPKLLVEDKAKFESAVKKFQGVTSIPWQLLPLWADTLPKDLSESDFTRNNNVSIGLKIGAKGLKDYENEIKDLFYDGRFLLFLRNTSLVQFSNYDLRVRKFSEENKVKLRLDFKDSKPKFLTYSTTGFEVPVDKELIDQLGLDLVRHEEDHPTEIGAKQYYFTNRDGKKLETIPPKVAAFKTANLSFAAPLIRGQVNEEPSFKKNERFSYFYTYLPMRENRLRLPFLVNADFIPSSNREELQGDNPWNHLLMGLIGTKMVEWVADLALQNEANYLNLLLNEEMKAEDNDVAELVEHFNNAYLNAIEEVAFIKNEDGELQTQSETVLDLVGLTKVIPTSLYHEITDTGKKLPAGDIDSSILKEEVFSEITKIGYAELLEALADDERCLALKKWMVNVPTETITPFINWIEEELIPQCEASQLKDELTDVLCILNLFQFDNEITSIIQNTHDNSDDTDKLWFSDAEQLRLTSGYIEWLNEKNEYALLIKTERLKKYADVLGKTGFRFSDDFSPYTNITNILLTEESLNKNAELLYSKIRSYATDQTYTTAEAAGLLRFIKSIGGGYYEKAVTELAVFVTQQGVKLPLSSILHQEVQVHHEAFLQFRLSDADWKVIKGSYLEESTITYDNVIEALVCEEENLAILKAGVGAENLKSFYDALTKYLDESDYEDMSRQSLEVLCVSAVDGLLFDIPNHVLFNEALHKLSRDEFDAVKEILEECSNYELQLPVYEALNFIERAAFKCKDESVVSSFKSTLEVPVSSVDALIKYLKSSGHVEPLFDRVTFTESENRSININIHKTDSVYQVKADQELLEIANSGRSENLFIPLPASIKDGRLKSLKLLTELDLIDYLIEEGEYDCEFVQFVEGKGAERENDYLLKLSEIPLSIIETASNKDAVVTLNLIKPLLGKEELSSEEGKLLGHVRDIITIDGKNREEYNTAQDIVLKSNTDSNKRYKFKLSKLIETSGKGLSIDEIKNVLPKWSAKEIEKLFEPHRVSPLAIQEVLQRKNDYTGYQFAFTVCHFDAGSTRAKDIRFGKSAYEDAGWINEYLDELKKQKAFHFFPLLKCLDVNDPHSIILDPKLKRDNSVEEPPQWLLNWVNKTEGNLKFLYESGMIGPNSDLINLRRQFLSGKFDDDFSALIHSKEIKIDAYNRTLEWLVNTIETLSIEQAKAYAELCEAMQAKAGNIISYVVQENLEDDESITYSFSEDAEYYIPSYRTSGEIKQIRTVAKEHDIPLIPNIYSDKFLKALSKIPVEIEREVLDETCIEDAELWNNSFYQRWPHRDTYKIYKIRSVFSRMDTVFDEVIDLYATDEDILEHDGCYYTNIQDDQDLALSLQLSNTAHNLELVKGIIADKSEPRRREEEEYDNPNYATEYEEIVRDFRDLDRGVQMSKNKEALEKGMEHLFESGFEFTQASVAGNAIYGVKKDGISYTFYFHSSVGGLLFLAPNIMEDLYEPETGVVVLYPNGRIRHFIGIDELIENPENSYFLLRAKNNQDKEQLRQMISVSRQYQSHFMFVTSEEMRKKLYDSREERKQNQSLKGQSDFDPSKF